MSFFSKIFGEKSEKRAANPRKGNFIDALSTHVRGEVEQALSAYLDIAEIRPEDRLAPFFTAAIKAGKGNAAEAAEALRSLSRRIALEGETISRAISEAVVAQVRDEPLVRIPAVADIVASFGDQLKQEGFLQETAVCYEIAAALVPDHGNVLHKLGDTLHDLRIYDYAESVLQEALKHAPNHWGALYTYALLLQDLGRDEEAIPLYERASRLYPEHVNCQNNYGAALLRTNRLDEALLHCSAAARLDPSSPFVKINLGNIHLLKQEYETARALFSEAISLNGNLAVAYFGLASAEQALERDPEQVKASYLKALEIAPALAEAHHALGNLLAGDGKEEALVHFTTAAQLNDNLKNLYRDFGKACLIFGRQEEAKGHFKMALQQNPDDVAVQEMVASIGG